MMMMQYMYQGLKDEIRCNSISSVLGELCYILTCAMDVLEITYLTQVTFFCIFMKQKLKLVVWYFSCTY